MHAGSAAASALVPESPIAFRERSSIVRLAFLARCTDSTLPRRSSSCIKLSCSVAPALPAMTICSAACESVGSPSPRALPRALRSDRLIAQKIADHAEVVGRLWPFFWSTVATMIFALGSEGYTARDTDRRTFGRAIMAHLHAQRANQSHTHFTKLCQSTSDNIHFY